MKLNIYKNIDMRGEDLLMSLPIESEYEGELAGLASNTEYYLQLVDDKDEPIAFEGPFSFATNYLTDEYPPSDYAEDGYRIKLERDGFYLYLGENIVEEVEGLQYSIGEEGETQEIESFPISIENLKDDEYIVIWQENSPIAFSEALHTR